MKRDRKPERYVKAALSLVNMGFMRGLSPDYLENTPPINDYVHDLVDADPFFAAHGFCFLREVASVGYRSPRLDEIVPRDSSYPRIPALVPEPAPAREPSPDARSGGSAGGLQFAGSLRNPIARLGR